MKQTAIFLLLACLLIHSAQGAFCSVICGTSCTGNLNTQCGTGTTNCQTDGAWSNTAGACVVKSNWVYFNSTSDYNSGTLTNTASLSGTCGDMQFYGFATPSTQITISANGILRPHYQMRIYVGIIALDMSCTLGSGACGGTQWYWNGWTAFFSMQFSDPLGTETATNPSYYKSRSNNQKTICYDPKFREYWTRVSKLYTAYNDSSALSWTIGCNETNTTAKWGIREFVILYRACSIACFTCYGASASQCYSCLNVVTDPLATTNYWLSNSTCNETCLSRFGESYTPYVCVYCMLNCTVCYGVFDNCSACTTSGTWASFLSSTANPSYSTCVNPCPDGFFANKVTRTCDPCNETCLTCINSATYCTACVSGYYWTGWFCYNPCPTQYFLDANGINCTKCSVFCSECITTNITCTACTLSGQYQAYLYNATAITGSCQQICPTIPKNLISISYYAESYGGAGPNLCLECNPNCTLCTGYPSPCSQCATGFFLLGTVCTDTCPTGYFASITTGTGLCLNCDVVCVGLTINMYFPSVTSEKIYIDMLFTQTLDFTTFNWQTFQDITITSKNIEYTLDMFTVTYALLSTTSYRITIEPKTYIFLYNATFTVTTESQPATADLSTTLMPFKTSNYLKSASLTWFLIKGPPFNNLETGIMNSFAKLSVRTNNFLTKPYVQEFKKSGVFNLLFSGAAITSCSMLSNQIQSQNLYEGVRVFASLVFFDAPPYEQISNSTKRFVAPTVEDQIRNAQEVEVHEGEGTPERLLFSTDTMYWRFQRTGQTSFFIYDVYVPMILIGLCWMALLVAYNSKGERWFVSYGPHIYSAVHKIHEMSLMYITMASIVEFIYFEPTSTDRFISAIICVFFNVYFAAYELYIYYDMIKYPIAEIGSKAYDYYVVRYGCFLRNIRFEEYDVKQQWSPEHWLRPYNFHLLSYYKKFVMMISLPLFYSVTYAQMAVLCFIQLIQLIRFWKTWPFASGKRNMYRLSLEIALLGFFLMNLIQISVLQDIMKAASSELEQLTKIFYSLGWTGFAMCLYFNISFISINIYDLCVGLRVTSRAKMDEARKKYYYLKIRDYEKDNEASSKDLVGRWVKLGNLNNKAYGELPEINVRIQFYEIRKVSSKYEVSIKKITSLQMKNKSKLRKTNHTTAGGKIETKLTLSPADNSRLYSIINDVYKRFEGPHVETIRIKTFFNVWQQKYNDGQEIRFNRNLMFQRVELISYDNDVSKQELEALMEDFPLEEAIINNAL